MRKVRLEKLAVEAQEKVEFRAISVELQIKNGFYTRKSDIICSQLGFLSDSSFSFIFGGIKISKKCALLSDSCDIFTLKLTFTSLFLTLLVNIG